MTASEQRHGGKRPGSGRKKGVPNKTTGLLKDAILAAAESVGEDGNGFNGLYGYLRSIAIEDKKVYASLLGRVMPLQLTGQVDANITVVTGVPRSDDD